MEFKPIETQEQFDKMVADRLQRQETKIRTEYADYEAIKKANAENAEKLANATEQISGLNAKVKGFELSALKGKVAEEMGIPHGLSGRLSGETEEEIRQDAEKLAPFLKGSTPAPLANSERNHGDDLKKGLRSLAASLGQND